MQEKKYDGSSLNSSILEEKRNDDSIVKVVREHVRPLLPLFLLYDLLLQKRLRVIYNSKTADVVSVEQIPK